MSDPEPSGPFSSWDDPIWDRPVRLVDAIKLWSPEFGSRLCEVLDEAGEVSVDEIWRAAEQRRQRAADAANATPELADVLLDPEISDSLRDDLARLLGEWYRWNNKDRLINASVLAVRLIIEKTRPGQPYILKYSPPVSPANLSGDDVPVGQAAQDGLGPYDFDLRASMIRNRGGNWLPARILGGSEAWGERMRVTRLSREAQAAAAAAAWAAERAKPMRKRQFFRYSDIADALATNPELEIDTEKRGRVVRDLTDWTNRGEFDLSGESEVVGLIGEPPHFVPLTPVGPDGILVDPEGLILRRRACRRYLENLSMDGAPRLLREWFPESAPGPRSLQRQAGTIVVNPTLLTAINNAVETLGTPGQTVQWKPFCDHVRRECKVTAETRGFGDKSIKRAVTRIYGKWDM